MASFISTLSLFLLVLTSGYFTLPLNDKQLETSTVLLSNVDLTSESPLVPRALLMNQDKNQFLNTQVEQTTDSLMGLHMTTLADHLLESASRESRILKELTTLSPLMLTTDKLESDKRGLNDLLLTTVESTTEDDQDNDATSEDNVTMENQPELENGKREVLSELTTNTLPLTSTDSVVVPEFTTEKSSVSKPSKKFTGLLKEKKSHKNDLEKEKDVAEKEPVESSEPLNKEHEDDKVKSDDEDKKSVKPSKTYKKVKEDDKVQSDDEDKEKLNKTDKKEKEDDKIQTDADSKNTVAPTALFQEQGMKNINNYPKEYMDLDETNTFTVTQTGLTDSTTTLKHKKGKKPLNQGEESSTAKEEESNN